MDDEILKTVESMLGANIQVVDCEKTQTIREEEVLLINGVPVTLEGSDGNAIKKALIAGEIPSCEMLNQLLFRAGVLRQPVQLETSLSVKTSTVTTEDITIARNGRVLDERSCETKENNYYTSTSSEIWEPVSRLKKKKQQEIINTATVEDMLSNQLKNGLYLVTNESSTENAHNHPIRQSSTCTESSTSSSAESNYSSSRPVSNVSNTSYDNFVCQITPMHQKAKDSNKSYTKISSNKQSISCDSGNDEVTLTSVYSSGIGGGHEYYPFSDISKTNTTNSMQTDSSLGCEFSPPTSFHDVPDFAAIPQSGCAKSTTPHKKRNRTLLRSRPQKHVPKNHDASASGTDDPSLNDDNCLVYRDGNLISGTLETLIKHMVPTDEYYPDQSYLFAFLLSARLFIKPHELLQQICDICHQQQQLNVHLSNNNNGVATQQKAQSLGRFACNFIQLLSEWIETFPYDFRDERVMQHVRAMTQKCISIDGKLRTDVSTLLQNLLQRLKTLEKYEEFLDKIVLEGSKELDTKHQRADSRNSSNSFHQATEKSCSSIHHQTSSSTSSVNSISSISSTLSTPDITDLCPSTSVLAHQLTHIELERLSYIGPEEFVQAFAKENPNVETSIKDMKKTRNLESYVQWFNRLSYIVATEVCKHSKKKQRARVIEFWIETARESFNIGNFNTLMAIIAGLNLSPITRLKKTWAKIQSAKFSILEHQMDPTSNFSSYRSTLKAAMWRSEGATDERQRIVIPFFSLLVKDLYFLNEGCTNKLPNGHINFEKFWQLAKQVNEFIGWKQVTCPYEKNNKIIMFLQTNSILNENTLAMASFDCEPPENSSEKDRYKSLKHEHYNN
ncbi:ras-GEF domain-containing family member 1B-like isoform X2 [Topomyia yanbarensis]|uniref:ras-GEF domain-containing family member 1B-like isoform X2 n=1 Tax=Topomyia yanbarensis TaxID=2498891 RepID=UPI00273BB944|nr:ras-GEF domain-containing family member 1B-like isoform X2 [Topomyia yanbarensis]XP_058811847.1 ras-GEF domain-containing family member 1B-like isoform X2 [Topomyia yanbarensis]XP_058811856.1 ras-GEF domain-containing family member 1B-like isoform X2 [Topomyia yanbarensis]